MIVLTHNAYWFQGSPSIWGQEEIRAHPRILDALTELYAGLQADVICLQEVPDASIADRLATALGMQVGFAPGGLRPGYGGVILWRGDGAAVTDQTLTRNRRGYVFERISLRLDHTWHQRRISIVNVHLASNRFAPEGGGEPVRLAELDAALTAGARPDLVAGDFNAVPDSAVYASMLERGYVDTHQGSCHHGRPADRCIDYIWVHSDSGLSVAAQDSVTDKRFQMPAPLAMALSDHHPIWTCLAPQETRPDLDIPEKPATTGA
jgi:endonuclease/exonuclease/phosphatase family metal-dependent hydrolase